MKEQKDLFYKILTENKKTALKGFLFTIVISFFMVILSIFVVKDVIVASSHNLLLCTIVILLILCVNIYVTLSLYYGVLSHSINFGDVDIKLIKKKQVAQLMIVFVVAAVIINIIIGVFI